MPKIIRLADAIEQRIDRTTNPTGCWLWMGQRDKDGYGTLSRRPRPIRIHRWMWEQIHGPIPSGLQMRHSCDNTSCVNPAHLSLGTSKDNKHDSVERNRHAYGTKTGNSILDKRTVREIRAATGTLKEIAARFDTDFTNVWKIRRRISWAHVK